MTEKNKRKSLLKNTIMLYLLTFSTYLIGFILVPYQTRVLLPEKYGILSVATAVMTYFQLIIDFGFLLSATEEVSLNRDDKKKLSKIFTSITTNKILLSLMCFIVLFVLCGVIEQWKDSKVFFLLTFIATMLGSLIPDYLYRGLEKMEAITIRTVAIKVFFATMVFVFVKKPEDYYIIPVLNIIGNSVALLFVYAHLYFKLNIKFVRFNIADLLRSFKTSAIFFLSRIATTVYTVTNTVILDLVFGSATAGYYASADKLISTAKSGVAPITDSLYPYMVKNKDFKLVKKILLIIEPLIIIACTIVFIWAKPLCVWFFGAEYADVAPILRAMIPIAVVVFPNYIFGFPVLGAMGLNKYANYSIFVATAMHILILLVLYFTNTLNAVTLGVATSISECVVLIYRISVVIKYSKRGKM